VIAAAAGWLLLKERVSRLYVLGAAIAFAGVACLAHARAAAGAGPAQGAAGLVGDTLGLVAAFWYALYLLIVRRQRAHVSAAAAMLVTTFAAAGFALVVSLALGEQILPRTANGVMVLAGLGLVVQAAGQGLIAYGLGQVPIALSTILLWVQPLAAAGLGWALFGEAIGALGFLGAGLVFAGVWLAQARGEGR
jgi:drug/metabolite transporter (DMT)-like permease